MLQFAMCVYECDLYFYSIQDKNAKIQFVLQFLVFVPEYVMIVFSDVVTVQPF